MADEATTVLHKIKITNRTQSARGFPAVGHIDPAWIDQGQHRTLVMTDGDAKNVEFHAAHSKGLLTVERLGIVEEVAAPLAAPLTTDPVSLPAPPPAPVEPEKDQFEDMSDAALRAYITDTAGTSPHPATGREKLLAKARELAAPKSDEAI